MSNIYWTTYTKEFPYSNALHKMEEAVKSIMEGGQQQIWALEHPSLFTAGSSSKPQDWYGSPTIPVHDVNRGGRITYHGPGQRILYVMMDLKRYKEDLHLYISMLQQWIIHTLELLEVKAMVDPDNIGVWVVDSKGCKAKIAAIGVHVRKWVTSHGIALNVSPELSYYEQIIPCGVKEFGVISLKELGIDISREEIDKLLQATFPMAMKDIYGTDTKLIKNKTE